MASSLVSMNEDMILEIMSHCSATDIEKFRLLNKDLNKRSCEMYFIDRHLHRTNSVFGFFIQHLSRFVSFAEEAPEKSGISLEFLPSRDVRIEACDTRHGILLCVDYNKFKGAQHIPDYIVCKPATKQYRIIPNPKTRYWRIASGLMVIQSNPFRYKIVRVSKPMPQERRKEKKGFYNLNCEVFDSGTFAWKRLDDLELTRNEFFKEGESVSSWGYMNWLMSTKKIIRFCMRTETWSFLSVPREVEEGNDDSNLHLVNYEGKLGLISWNLGQKYYGLWVLEKGNGKSSSWVYLKDVEIKGLRDEYGRPLWFLSNDVVAMACFSKLAVYNMNSNECRYIELRTHHRFPVYLPKDYCFPFYSNFERVRL